VDDSALVRKLIADAVAGDPEIQVVGAACDPYVARDMILQHNPDVLTLDLEMPRMDGLTFLKLMQQHRPIPTVIVSSLSQAGSRVAMAALEAGAVEVLGKPDGALSVGKLAADLPRCIKSAAASRRTPIFAGQPAVAAGKIAPISGVNHPRQLIVIGASTGGVEALRDVLSALPDGLPGICIVQHMPPHFTKLFAERLSAQCRFEVREAAHGETLRPGLALVAPGDFHMAVNWSGSGYQIALNQRPAVHHCRPAVDVLFRSAATAAGRHAVGAILTGMGCDGAAGMKEMLAAGARTLAQDEASCVVFGMPRAAIELGAAERVVPLPHMAQAIVNSLRARTAADSAVAA
jgi:two-component system chemotaxis response regulator CheB